MIIKKWQAEDSRKDKNNKPHEETTRAPKVPSFPWPRRVVAWLGPLDDSAPPGFGPQCRVGFLLCWPRCLADSNSNRKNVQAEWRKEFHGMHRWIIGFKSLAPTGVHFGASAELSYEDLGSTKTSAASYASMNEESKFCCLRVWRLELEEPAFSPQSTTQNRRIVQILWGSNLAKFPQDPAPNRSPLLNSTAPGGVLFCLLA